MKIEEIKIADIKPYEKNAKTHPAKQIELLVKNIKKFGFTTPCLIDEANNLIAGHGRLEAVKKLGQETVPCVRMEGLTETEIKALRLADNKIAELGEWNMDLAIAELKELDDEELDLTGFDKDLIIEPDEKDDEVPEVPEEPKSKLGDLYILGNHRVLCGDSTKIEYVERLMDGEKADMVFTSPPYNANTKAGEGDIFNRKAHKKLYAEGYSDNLPADEYVKFAQSVLDLCFTFTEGFIFWNVSYNKNSRFQYIQQITPYLEFLIEQICWKKSSAIPFKGSMRRAWEPVYLFSTSKVTLGLDKVETNVWEVSNADSQTENHKACYPVALVEKGISIINGAKIILDPFLGSGTTMIAAEKTGRICYGMELDCRYVDTTVERWCRYTGITEIKKNGEDYKWELQDKK
jgi:DNA modification methylase